MGLKKYKCGHKSSRGLGGICRDCFISGFKLPSPPERVRKNARHVFSEIDEADRVREYNNKWRRDKRLRLKCESEGSI